MLDQPYYERTYMKRKQKDDIMGEDKSDLPVVEGAIFDVVNWIVTNVLAKFLEDAQLRRAHRNKHSFINYRPEVLTNRQLRSIDVLYVRSSGENTNRFLVTNVALGLFDISECIVRVKDFWSRGR